MRFPPWLKVTVLGLCAVLGALGCRPKLTNALRGGGGGGSGGGRASSSQVETVESAGFASVDVPGWAVWQGHFFRNAEERHTALICAPQRVGVRGKKKFAQNFSEGYVEFTLNYDAAGLDVETYRVPYGKVLILTDRAGGIILNDPGLPDSKDGDTLKKWFNERFSQTYSGSHEPYQVVKQP
jgi:hypothetical protein